MKARNVGGVVALAALFFALASAHAGLLHAAGDLDGDGRLDFVVESAREDGGTSVELWLSSGSAARYSECRAGC
jgi:hypothetical protein